MLLALCGLVSCTTSDDSDSGDSTSMAIATAVSSTAEGSVFSTMLLGSHAIQIMDFLVSREVSECMSKVGFEFGPMQALPDAQSLSEFLDRRYSVPITFENGNMGWSSDAVDNEGLGDGEPLGAEADPNGSSAEYAAALFGDPAEVTDYEVRAPTGELIQTLKLDNGCYGRSVVSALGDKSSYFALVSGLNSAEFAANRSYQSLFSDRELTEREASWSQCMTTAGFSFTHLLGPTMQEWTSPRPSSDENRAAKQDSQCRAAAELTTSDLLAIETRIQMNDQVVAGIDFAAFNAAAQSLVSSAAT